MKQLTIKESNGFYTTETEDEKMTITSGGSKTLFNELFLNLMKERATTYKHDILRFEPSDQKEIMRRFEYSIDELKQHMEYVIDNFYKARNTNE